MLLRVFHLTTNAYPLGRFRSDDSVAREEDAGERVRSKFNFHAILRIRRSMPSKHILCMWMWSLNRRMDAPQPRPPQSHNAHSFEIVHFECVSHTDDCAKLVTRYIFIAARAHSLNATINFHDSNEVQFSVQCAVCDAQNGQQCVRR